MHALRREMGGLMLTPEQCAEIKARWAAATPGPWRLREHSYPTPEGGDADWWLVGEGVVNAPEADATAIAAAPTDIVAILATVEALRAELAEAVRVLSELEWVWRDWGGGSTRECPDCCANEYNSKGKHEDGCELSAFLARHGGA